MMKLRAWSVLLILLGACLLATWFVCRDGLIHSRNPLPHHLYIWNRTWDESMIESIRHASSKATRFVVLASQIDKKDGGLIITKVPVSFAAFRDIQTELGLAIRVSSLPRSTTQALAFHQAVRTVAEELLQEVSREHVSLSEIQIDYDCPESGLEDYRKWIEEFKPVVKAIPLTVTALPAWVKHKEFVDFVKATDGFVLQVHSLKIPASPDEELTLCDPGEVSRWVSLADVCGVPFRMALPTYGYTVAFNPQGAFAGLWAEGPQPDWPSTFSVREVHTDPGQIARLVTGLQAHPPNNLTGYLWFRMPLPADHMNWSWSTLARVMEGHAPKPILEAKGTQAEPGLVDVVISNVGEVGTQSRVEISVQWEHTHLHAADGLGGYVWSQPNPTEVLFTKDNEKLRAGETRSVGWLRFEKKAEVQIDVRVFD